MFLETARGTSKKCGPRLRKSLWSWSQAPSATTSTSSLWLGSTRAKTKVISSGTLHLGGKILTPFPFAWGEGTVWEKNKTKKIEFDRWKCRFNPHLISESGRKPKSEEMVLASVMNDVGNGNKDEVILLLIFSFYNLFSFCFSSSSCPSAPSLLARKTRMGGRLATFLPLLGVLTAFSKCWQIRMTWTISGVKYFGGGPVERVPFFWYNMCFTVAYVQGVGAVRLVMQTKKSPKYKISFVGGYMSMAS